MGRTWLSIRIELVASGGSEPLWPRPGRVLIVRPGMTFADLAGAIDTAFGRWDLSPEHRFVLGDGTWVGATAPEGTGATELATTKLTRLALGEKFLYEFDLVERWQHLCTVSMSEVDPAIDLGISPRRPTVIGGWGSIPDQHRRYWEHDARDGSMIPRAPEPPMSDLPPLDPWWELVQTLSDPEPGADFPLRNIVLDDVDDEEEVAGHIGAHLGLWHDEAVLGLRTALATNDDESLYWLLTSFDAVKVAHQCAPALLRLCNPDVPNLKELIGGIIIGLEERGWDGDAVLAAQLDQALNGSDIDGPPRRRSDVDIDVVAAILSNPADPDRMWTLDVPTGRLLAPGLAPSAAGGDTAPEHLPIMGLGPLPLEEDTQVVAKAVGFAISADESSESRLLLEERKLGRARAWLDAAGIVPS